MGGENIKQDVKIYIHVCMCLTYVCILLQQDFTLTIEANDKSTDLLDLYRYITLESQVLNTL